MDYQDSPPLSSMILSSSSNVAMNNTTNSSSSSSSDSSTSINSANYNTNKGLKFLQEKSAARTRKEATHELTGVPTMTAQRIKCKYSLLFVTLYFYAERHKRICEVPPNDFTVRQGGPKYFFYTYILNTPQISVYKYPIKYLCAYQHYITIFVYDCWHYFSHLRNMNPKYMLNICPLLFRECSRQKRPP